MKLLRYGPRGKEKPGLLDADGQLRDLSGRLPDIDAAALSPRGLAAIRRLDPGRLPRVAGRPRLGAPVAGNGKVVGIGLNYHGHAGAGGWTLPPEPIFFLKASSAIAGPNDPIRLPAGAHKADWEVELAIVVGGLARRVPASRALSRVAGYCVGNDLSERAFQFERGPTWDKGKSCDGFCPLGPWLVTADEVGNPQDLALWLTLNGETMQRSSTRDMVFDCAELLSYVSHFMTLHPGDVILTGTPPGSGFTRQPPRFLAPGDRLALGIAGLGEQHQRILAAAGGLRSAPLTLPRR